MREMIPLVATRRRVERNRLDDAFSTAEHNNWLTVSGIPTRNKKGPRR